MQQNQHSSIDISKVLDDGLTKLSEQIDAGNVREVVASLDNFNRSIDRSRESPKEALLKYLPKLLNVVEARFAATFPGQDNSSDQLSASEVSAKWESFSPIKQAFFKAYSWLVSRKDEFNFRLETEEVVRAQLFLLSGPKLNQITFAKDLVLLDFELKPSQEFVAADSALRQRIVEELEAKGIKSVLENEPEAPEIQAQELIDLVMNIFDLPSPRIGRFGFADRESLGRFKPDTYEVLISLDLCEPGSSKPIVISLCNTILHEVRHAIQICLTSQFLNFRGDGSPSPYLVSRKHDLYRECPLDCANFQLSLAAYMVAHDDPSIVGAILPANLARVQHGYMERDAKEFAASILTSLGYELSDSRIKHPRWDEMSYASLPSGLSAASFADSLNLKGERAAESMRLMRINAPVIEGTSRSSSPWDVEHSVSAIAAALDPQDPVRFSEIIELLRTKVEAPLPGTFNLNCLLRLLNDPFPNASSAQKREIRELRLLVQSKLDPQTKPYESENLEVPSDCASVLGGEAKVEIGLNPLGNRNNLSDIVMLINDISKPPQALKIAELLKQAELIINQPLIGELHMRRFRNLLESLPTILENISDNTQRNALLNFTAHLNSKLSIVESSN